MLRPLIRLIPVQLVAALHPTQLLLKRLAAAFPGTVRSAANPFTGIGNRVNLL